MWRVEFDSDRFLPLLPEVSQANPGVYGFELAWWLSQQLAARGIVTSYPQAEDWGWFIKLIPDRNAEREREIFLDCGSVSKAGEAARNQPLRWTIFMRQPRSLRDRLRGANPSNPMADTLAQAVMTVLQAEGLDALQVEQAN